MGTEAKGTLIVGGQKVPVAGDFGSDRVLFSGGRRGPVSYKDIEVIGITKGRLKLRVDGAVMEFDFGGSVDRIAQKIRKPPTRLDKMGIKPGVTAAVVDLEDKRFITELRTRVPDAFVGKPPEPVDVLILGVEATDDLGAIVPLIRHFKEDGGMWIVYPKGRRDVTEMQVIEAGRAAGLKDVKIMRFTEKLSAMRFVVPFADR